MLSLERDQGNVITTSENVELDEELMRPDYSSKQLTAPLRRSQVRRRNSFNCCSSLLLFNLHFMLAPII